MSPSPSPASVELFLLRPDPSFAPLVEFWAAARRGELALPRCATCGEFTWYPGTACSSCGGPLAWVAVAPTGTVVAATRVHHAFQEPFAALVPFRVALVEPTDAPGVRLVLRVHGDGPVPDPRSAVTIRFVVVDDATTMPVAHLEAEA